MGTSIKNQKKVDQQDLEMKVKDMYRKVALNPEIEYHFEMGRDLAERLGYPPALLDKLPPQSIESFAGVGYYFDLADLKNAETILDLGSGSGMDVFYAAEEIGESGKVIGIDMTDEQLEKSGRLRDEAGYTQIEFRKAYIEDLPVDSGSVDVVISNGVINLSSEKQKVFKEAARILKKGGRLAIADIVSGVKLPENISCNATLWAACIGGAMQVDEYKKLIEEAGMKIIKVKDNPYKFISKSAQGATRDFEIKSISILAIKD